MAAAPHRVHNFYAGPAALPLSALERAQRELLDFAGTGMSVMELSHRSQAFMALNAEAQGLVRELMELPDNYKVLFLQGGASLQFAMVPMNLLGQGGSADYLITGDWAKKAFQEAKKVATARIAYSAEGTRFDRVPTSASELELNPEARYVHLTSNNTLHGTAYASFPDTGTVPLVADMSSDILSRRFDVRPFGLVYAGAQKNLGPSGVTLVVIRDDLLSSIADGLPTMLSYRTHADNDSLYNTPPTMGVYMLRNVLAWIKEIGGMPEIERRNQAKAELLYSAIDRHADLYRGHARPEARSRMNVTWTMPTPELEASFLAGANQRELIGLAGHRSVGGFRASIYNAVPYQSVEALVEYMETFARQGRP